MILNIAFQNEYDALCGMLNIEFLHTISRQNILSFIDVLQLELEQPYKNQGVIMTPQIIQLIQNIFAESAIVRIDENLKEYGVENIKEMLDEFQQKLVLFFKNDKIVELEQEGSSNIIEELLEEYIH